MSEKEMALTSPVDADATASSARRILSVLAAVFGGLILLLSLCGVLAYLYAPLRGGADALTNNTLLGSLIAMGLVFGGLLVVVGSAGARSRELPALRLSTPWLFLGIFFIVIGLGQGVLLANVATPYLFPPWHVLASAMLPVAVLAYAVRRLPPTAGPGVPAEFVWGGLGTFLLGLVFELIAGIFIALVALLLILLALGQDALRNLVEQLGAVRIDPRDPERILSILSSQPAVMVIAGTAAIAFLVVIAPFIEEALKAAGPAAWIARNRPPAATALLWGLAAGAGFAFSENLLNGASGATPLPGAAPIWAPAMTVRVGTSLIHMAATGTATLGWYVALVQRHRLQFFVFFLIAWLAHGLWNMVALLLSVAFSAVSFGSGPDLASSRLGALAGTLSLGIFAGLILIAALWIHWLVHWARQQDLQAAASGPAVWSTK